MPKKKNKLTLAKTIYSDFLSDLIFMKLSEILKEDFIIPNLTAQTKSETISELCQFLQEKGVIDDSENLKNALLEREKLGSTGIGDNVAIPHAKLKEINAINILFARSIKGISYEALDKKPVHFVFLLLAPPESTNLHLKALARIARVLQNEELRNQILTANDETAIYSKILEEDSKID